MLKIKAKPAALAFALDQFVGWFGIEPVQDIVWICKYAVYFVRLLLWKMGIPT